MTISDQISQEDKWLTDIYIYKYTLTLVSETPDLE